MIAIGWEWADRDEHFLGWFEGFPGSVESAGDVEGLSGGEFASSAGGVGECDPAVEHDADFVVGVVVEGELAGGPFPGAAEVSALGFVAEDPPFGFGPSVGGVGRCPLGVMGVPVPTVNS